MSKKESRRDFIKKTAVVAGTVSLTGLSPLLNSCENYIAKDRVQCIEVEIDVNSKENRRYLTKIGGGLLKKFDNVNFGIAVIIVKIADNTYKCYSSMCTHNNCFGKESYHDIHSKDKGNIRPPMGKTLNARSIVCKCHGSRYDPFDEGRPYQGPSERPLTQYPCEFNPNTGILKISF